MFLSPREPLSAPAKRAEIHTLNVVILIVSIISALGAGWIIISFILFRSVRTFRHQLILGLAISDFLMAINFMSSSAVNISGHIISEKPQEKFCDFNGFMTQVFVVQTDYWVLLIAVCTFFIVANHKRQSTWVQEHRIILWCLPWGFSILWAALGMGLIGYGDIGAWCWFTSDKVRLLVNFIPRWLIILTLLALYARLYLLIHKAHNRFHSFDHPSGSLELAPSADSISSTHRIGKPGPTFSTSTPRDSESGPTAPPPRLTTHTRGPNPVLKKMAYQMMLYPLVYMVIWTIPTAVRIYQAVTGKPAPFGIATVDKSCIVIQGFADALIYGFNEASMGVWRAKLFPRRQAERRGGGTAYSNSGHSRP
ncbi:family A G protein-coupled receptor-like protein [Lophium mytilinum]|uniref:Family A G protein-coupled receptor-like protein n=1 Tax=Lophium mytilinum TaxID=390894 RepID=A0A6A6QUK1_9PEZI|nr:family A G protein-coupled receptor-like protein [Lophium mytilinum]